MEVAGSINSTTPAANCQLWQTPRPLFKDFTHKSETKLPIITQEEINSARERLCNPTKQAEWRLPYETTPSIRDSIRATVKSVATTIDSLLTLNILPGAEAKKAPKTKKITLSDGTQVRIKPKDKEIRIAYGMYHETSEDMQSATREVEKVVRELPAHQHVVVLEWDGETKGVDIKELSAYLSELYGLDQLREFENVNFMIHDAPTTFKTEPIYAELLESYHFVADQLKSTVATFKETLKKLEKSDPAARPRLIDSLEALRKVGKERLKTLQKCYQQIE